VTVNEPLGERLRKAPTPWRIRAYLYAVWGIAGTLVLVGGLMLFQAWNAIKTVGKDTAPSIIYAQEISFSLADLDANAGNYLLGSRKDQAAALKTFEDRRSTVTARLVEAAKNITEGDAEKVPINTLFDGLGRYLELFAEMRYRKDNGDAGGAQGIYLNATELMHQKMLPAADALDSANFKSLQREYHSQQVRSEGAEGIAGFLAAALVGVLVSAQVFLRRRTRRVFSVPLLVATAIGVAFGAYLVWTISNAREDLKVAKEDAFDSIHALWQADAIAYDANGDETRYLLGGIRAGVFEQQYREKVKKLATVTQPGAGMFDTSHIPAAYQGFFAMEMRNITFRGEREAALQMIKSFAAYDNIDGKIRAAEQAGKHADAVELAIGTGKDQSNAAFERFDTALRRVIDINHKEFDRVVDAGMRALVIAGILLPLAALLVSALALVGLRRRLREYAA
jgi:hypothetical protein